MKRMICIAMAVCLMLVTAGCSSSVAYSYTMDNGDYIRLELDASDGYELSAEVPFTISQNGEERSVGQFLYGEYYEESVSSVQSAANTTVIETGEKDGHEYMFWNYNDSEYNYIIRVADSNSAIVIGNLISEESARECFDRLTIVLEG